MNNEDYLWDRSGEPDAEVQRLEHVMRQLRPEPPVPPRSRAGLRVALLVAAAATVLVVMWPTPEPTSWRVGDKALHRGEVVEQGRVLSASVGSLDVEPGSRLLLHGKNRFRLERGVVRAFVWAPPREFVVDTPAATAVDMGCAYTLTVAPDGSGLLSVTTGWVALDGNKLEAFVPAGAECRTRKGRGPGTPYYQDASVAVREGVTKWDQGDASGFEAALRESRERDALTLWHLVARTEGEQRTRVVDRLAALIPIQNRAGLLNGDRKAMDEAWAALGLGGADWWRGWKQNF